MLVQTGEIIWSGKGAVSAIIPSRATNCCRAFSRSFIPSRRLIVGLVAGVFSLNIRASVLLCVSRTILMRAVRVLAPVSGFITTTACIAPKPHLYLRDWMVVDYLPGEVKTYLPDTNELAGLLYYLHQQPRFGWRITLLPLLELYWQQSDPARRTVGWLRMLKRLRKAREPAFTLKSIAYGCPRRKFSA